MEPKERSIQIPKDTDQATAKSRQQKLPEPLFKMKIGDLLSLKHDPDTKCIKFKNHDLSLVMCGGKITKILRDDSVFSFELDDGSGAIPCFHQFKREREDLLKNLTELKMSAQFSLLSTCSNQTSASGETSNDANATSNTVVQNRENVKSEAFREILSWFREKMVEKPESRKIGDLIHVKGHLMYGDDGIRKINVIDFRMATNAEREDMALEIDYLNQCVY